MVYVCRVERIPPIDSENIDELAAMEESGEEDEESQDAKRAITYQVSRFSYSKHECHCLYEFVTFVYCDILT